MPSSTVFPILRLAPELRLKIYSHYFSQTPLHYPSFHSALVPLLLTSRQIYNEASPLLHTSTHYIFPTASSLLTYLFSLSAARLRLLRYITVRGDPIPLYDPNDDVARSGFITYHLQSFLSLFPGLQLDTLTIWDAYHGPGVIEDGWGDDCTYLDLCDLVTGGKGWRNLVYRSQSDAWFTEGDFLNTPGRKVGQPAGWKASLLERDGGVGCGCLLEMGITKAGDPEAEKGYVPWDVENVYVWVPDERGREDEAGGKEQQRGEQELSWEERYHRPKVGIEVRVRRGRGCDYVQDGVLESNWCSRLSRIFEKLSWKELQEQGYYVKSAEDDPCSCL